MKIKSIILTIILLLASFVAQCGETLVVWQDKFGSEQGYIIERSDDFVNFVEIAQVPADTVQFSDFDLDSGLYVYRIKAIMQKGIKQVDEQIHHVE